MSGTLKLSFVIEAVDAATAKLAAINKAVERVDAPTKKLAASTRALMREAGWDKVLASMGPVRERTAGLINTTQNLALAYGAATAAAGGLFALLKRNIDQAGDVADLSIKLGTSTERLTRLQFAAEQAGGSAQGMGEALRFLSTNMSAARGGDKEMLKWLARGGVTLGDLRDKTFGAADAFERFGKTFEAVSDTPLNATRKIEFAQALMGRAGANNIQLLNGGRQAVREAAAESDRYGYTLKTSTGAAMKEFGDNYKKLEASILGVTRLIAQFALPALDAMVKKFTELNVVNREKWGKEFGIAIGQIISALPGFLSVMGQIGSGMAWVAEKAGLVAKAMGGWQKVINLVGVLLGFYFVGKLFLLLGALAEAGLALRAFSAAMGLAGLSVLAPILGFLAFGAVLAGVIVYWDELIATGKQWAQMLPSWMRGEYNGGTPLFGSADAAAPTAVATALPRGRAPFKDGLSGTLKIDIDSEGRPRVRELKQSSGGLLAFDVSLGIPMAGL